MCEKLVEKEELRPRAGNGTAQAREVMQLSECAGKSRLAALVRTGDDEDAFPILKVKVIANRGGLVAPKLAGQGQIETLIIVNLFGCLGDDADNRTSIPLP